MKTDPHRDDLIDLGPATVETKGPTTGRDDSHVGQIPFTGLSDD